VQVALEEEEIGIKRSKSADLVRPTRARSQEWRVSLEEVIDVVQELKWNIALLKIVQQVLVGSASQRWHELQLDLKFVLGARPERS
jgi:hypothetical protein